MSQGPVLRGETCKFLKLFFHVVVIGITKLLCYGRPGYARMRNFIAIGMIKSRQPAEQFRADTNLI